MIGEGSKIEFLARQIPNNDEKPGKLPIDELPKNDEGQYRLDPNRVLTPGLKKGVVIAAMSAMVGGGVGIERIINDDKKDKGNKFTEVYDPNDFFQESRMEDPIKVSGYPQNLSDFFLLVLLENKKNLKN